MQNLHQTLSPILHQHICSINTLCKTEREHYFHTLAIKFKKIHSAQSSSKQSTQILVYVFGMSKPSRYRNLSMLIVRDGLNYDTVNWKSEEYIKQLLTYTKYCCWVYFGRFNTKTGINICHLLKYLFGNWWHRGDH